MNYFFTADTHFGHENIIKYVNRPFDSVREMDETLISNWNYMVGKGDIVYHLGDFCLGRSDEYLKRLNGEVIILRGSHDGILNDWPEMLTVHPAGLIDEYGHKRFITLCHYAMRSWPLSHYASWHLFGHHHGRLEPYGLSFDVGVDCNNYYPFHLSQIIDKMEALKPIVDFRNKS